MIDFYKIFNASVLTEKYSTFDSFQGNKFAFYSYPWVTKKMVRSALLSEFPKVVVGKISSINIKGSKRRFKGIQGRCKNRKRFVVNVLHGNIDVGLVG